jgi:glutaryl-CoA dehydrogenase
MAPVSPLDLLALDSLLSEEERAMRHVVRRAVDEHVRPQVAQWFEDGRAPTRDLAKRFGALGLLGCI